MGIIFGKKKQSRVTEQDKAVLQLKQQRDKIKQYQKRIELSLQSDREVAKKLLAKGNKERAKLLLRKKRFQEQMLQKTDGHLETLERLTHDIEFAQVELQVVAGLKQGNEALKKINDALNITDIEKILDETREAADKQQEISNLLSGALTDEDETAVEEELEQIIADQLPAVPIEEPVPPEEPKLEEGEPEVPVSPTKEKEKRKERKAEKIAVALEA